MKRYLLLFIIVPFFVSCGAGGGGGGTGGNNSNAGSGTGNKTNPLCSSYSNIAKVKINEDGVYRIAYPALYNACLDLYGVDPAALKVTNQGKEIAIDVVDSNNNGSFDDGDYIEFYGKAIPRGDGRFKYTETNVYWLSVEGGQRKRVEEIPSNPDASAGTLSFLKVLHNEEDSWYEQKNYPEVKLPKDIREHWFWGEVFYTPGVAGGANEYYMRDYNFSTPYLDKNKPVSLKLRLQSVSGSHHIRGYINNQNNLVIDETWSGQEPFELEVPVPVSYLTSIGTNILRLESVGDTSSGIYEIFYLDWFEVKYYHLYKAEHDTIKFTGGDRIDLSGFTSSDISVYEISDPLNVKKIVPVSVGGSILSGYSPTFSYLQSPEGRFFALTADKKRYPLTVEAYTPANIRSKNANYIIITHEDFYDAIIPLANYRGSSAGGGYRVLTVKVEDIYNEFSDGVDTPQAIKDFLTYAHNTWSARYVLFVGDATIDYKDISGYGRDYDVKSYVPAYLYNYPGLGEVPSDNWFVDVNDDVLPEMNIGRIPAKSPADVSSVVNKIVSQENTSIKSNGVLLIADYDTISGTLFESLSESIAGVIPVDYNVSKLYQGSSLGDFRAEVIPAINLGPLIVNYTGHGSVVNWTREDIFSSGDVIYLTNKSYPFVVALNCLNGYFVLPNDGVPQDGIKQYPSIAEALLLAQDTGAVAVFTASAIGYPSEHDPLAQELYKIVFSQDMTLGEAVTRAKEAAYKNGEIMEDVVETFIFFGDPATRLK